MHRLVTATEVRYGPETLFTRIRRVKECHYFFKSHFLYLVLDELISGRGKRLFYDKFRKEWLDLYKEVYNFVSKMKTRRSSRGSALR